MLVVVSAPGRSPARLIPWVGDVQLLQEEAPFREPPESQFTVLDFAVCDVVLSSLVERQADVEAALRSAIR